MMIRSQATLRAILLTAAALLSAAPTAQASIIMPGTIVVSINDSGTAPDALLAVDPRTGGITVLSGAFNGSTVVGTGPDFSLPTSIALDAAGNLVVADSSLDAVFSVDPLTGNRTILSDANNAGTVVGTGPAFSSPNSITVDAAGNLLVVDSGAGLDAVISVDPLTGNREILSDGDNGTGPDFVLPTSIAVDAAGNLLVVDSVLDAVVSVDPLTGNRETLSDDDNGTGPNLNIPESITLDAAGNLLLVDTALDAVISVDPLTGNREILSDDGNGIGPEFEFPESIAVDAVGNLLVADAGLDAVISVDPLTGNRTQLVGFGTFGSTNGPTSILVVPGTASTAAVPEPHSLALFASVGMGLSLLRRRRTACSAAGSEENCDG